MSGVDRNRVDLVSGSAPLIGFLNSVEWHMRVALAPQIFDDDHKSEAEALQESIMAPAQPNSSMDIVYL